MPAESEIILFAIRGAVRLGLNIRQSYVEATQERALTLPLPNFTVGFDAFGALAYFTESESGKAHVVRLPRLKTLMEEAKAGVRTMPPDHAVELTRFYRECFFIDHPRQDVATDDALAAADVLAACVTIKQWRDDANPHASWLQHTAGALVEIAVDYVQTFPDQLRVGARYESAVRGVLDAIANAQLGAADAATWDVLPRRLLAVALESVAAAPQSISGNAGVQELVSLASTSLLEKLQPTLDGKTTLEAAAIADWAGKALRSVLARAIAQPEKFLGVKGAANQALVSDVGGAILALALDENGAPHGAALWSQDGLERVIDAALGVVAAHPEITGLKKDALRTLVGQVSSDLAALPGVLRADVLPEITRLVLLRTGENLPLLWPESQSKPEKNLALTIAQMVLRVVTAPAPANARWKPALRPGDLAALVDFVLREVSENPGWIVSNAGAADPRLADALTAMLAAIRANGDVRLNTDTAVALLRTGLSAVFLRPQFTAKIANGVPIGANAPGVSLIVGSLLGEVLRRLFDPALDAAALGQILRAEAIRRLTEEILLRLASRPSIDGARTAQVRAFFDKWIPRWTAGEPLEWTLVATELTAFLS